MVTPPGRDLAQSYPSKISSHSFEIQCHFVGMGGTACFLVYTSSSDVILDMLQEKAKGPENEVAKMEKLLSLVREPSEKKWSDTSRQTIVGFYEQCQPESAKRHHTSDVKFQNRSFRYSNRKRVFTSKPRTVARHWLNGARQAKVWCHNLLLVSGIFAHVIHWCYSLVNIKYFVSAVCSFLLVILSCWGCEVE